MFHLLPRDKIPEFEPGTCHFLRCKELRPITYDSIVRH